MIRKTLPVYPENAERNALSAVPWADELARKGAAEKYSPPEVSAPAERNPISAIEDEGWAAPPADTELLELAIKYENGLGLPQSDTEAIRYYRMAADLGNARAQCNLGQLYEFGRGVPKSYAEAVRN